MRPSATLLAGALALLVGCSTREPVEQPFAIRLQAASGEPVVPAEVPPGDPPFPFVILDGTAVVASPTEMTVDDRTRGPVTVTFDDRAAPGAGFNADRLSGTLVLVLVFSDPAAVAPDGTPIPYPALRVSTGVGEAEHFSLVLGDSPYVRDKDIPDIPFPARPMRPEGAPSEDIPFFVVLADFLSFYPADCGVIYDDVLRVFGELGDARNLAHGEVASFVIGSDPTPWTVRHVASWHRTGSCPDRPRSWTQFAAWR
jgi:hypothetical protein